MSTKVSTEKKIILAFLSLLPKKEINSISVAEIIDSASVSRSTFYSYFHSKEDLNSHSLTYLLDEMTSILNEDLLFNKNVMVKLFRYLKENRELFMILMKYYPGFEISIKKYIKNIILNSDIPNLRTQLIEAYQITDYLALDVYVTTIESIISSWIRYGSPETPEQLADILYTTLKI